MPRLPQILLSLHLMMAGGAVGGAQAQDAASARTSFLKRVLNDSQNLSDQYERALAKLESELASAADYEEAQLVQMRREELKSIYGQINSGAGAEIPLSPARARLSGSAEARGELLTGWRGSSSMAEWSAIRLSPGPYYLDLEASITGLPTSAGGALPERFMPQDKVSFVFYEVSLLPGAEENRRLFEIARTDIDGAFTPIRIGPLTFTRNSVTVRIVPTASYPGNVISMRNLHLRPAGDAPVRSAAPVPEGDALTLSKETLHRELIRAQEPIIRAHADALAALSTNPTLREETEAEVERLNELKQTTANTPQDALKHLVRQLGGVAGFINLDGAKLLSGTPINRGDEFTIEHGGRQIPIRLLWIRCAPDETKSDEAKMFAKHFGMEVENTAPLARSAREFTLGYLSNKPLRVLLRSNKNKDGKQSALVFLHEIGLYQNVLVDQGLAMVDVPRKVTGTGMTELGLLEGLKQREETAKRLKNGAWALGGVNKP